MAVSKVVAVIADAVAAARQPLSARHSCMLHLLRAMPAYSDLSRLDLWEAAYNAVESVPLVGDEDSTTEQLLDELFMLGVCNLYQAFNEARTRDFYNRLVPFFAERGVVIPVAPDLSGW